MRTRCQYHCAACHTHFTSLGAFDAHRAGDHEGERYCLDPLDLPDVFALKTEDGTCDARAPLAGVRLWWLRATAETFDPANPSVFHGVSRPRGGVPVGSTETAERYVA